MPMLVSIYVNSGNCSHYLWGMRSERGLLGIMYLCAEKSFVFGIEAVFLHRLVIEVSVDKPVKYCSIGQKRASKKSGELGKVALPIFLSLNSLFAFSTSLFFSPTFCWLNPHRGNRMFPKTTLSVCEDFHAHLNGKPLIKCRYQFCLSQRYILSQKNGRARGQFIFSDKITKDRLMQREQRKIFRK